jgi:hypothetical protein
MEQKPLIKYLQEGSHQSTQIHSKFVEHYRDMALSYPDVSHWVRKFRREQESVEDLKRSGRPPDSQTHFRIEGFLKASPKPSVRGIVHTSSITSSTLFCVLTEILRLEFRNWI